MVRRPLCDGILSDGKFIGEILSYNPQLRSNLGKATTLKAARIQAQLGTPYSSDEERAATRRLTIPEKDCLEEAKAMKEVADKAIPIGEKHRTMMDFFPTTSRRTSSHTGSIETILSQGSPSTKAQKTPAEHTKTLLKDMSRMVEEIENAPNKQNITNPTPSKDKRQRDETNRTVAESVNSDHGVDILDNYDCLLYTSDAADE